MFARRVALFRSVLIVCAVSYCTGLEIEKEKKKACRAVRLGTGTFPRSAQEAQERISTISTYPQQLPLWSQFIASGPRKTRGGRGYLSMFIPSWSEELPLNA